MAQCPDCNEPIYDYGDGPKHDCPNRPNMIRLSIDLFRIPETIQRWRVWWWKWRNKWGSSSGPGADGHGVQP